MRGKLSAFLRLGKAAAGLLGLALLLGYGCRKSSPSLPQHVRFVVENFFEGGLAEGVIKYRLEGSNGSYEGEIVDGVGERSDVLSGDYQLTLNLNGENPDYIISVRKIKIEDGGKNEFTFRIPKLEELLSGIGQDGKIYTTTARDWHRLWTPTGHYGRLVSIKHYYYWPKDTPQKYPRTWQRLLEWSDNVKEATHGDIDPQWEPYPYDNFRGEIDNSIVFKVGTNNNSSGWSGYTSNKSHFEVDGPGRLASEGLDSLLPGDNENRYGVPGWMSCLSYAEKETPYDLKILEFIYSRTRNGRKWDVYVVGENLKEVQK